MLKTAIRISPKWPFTRKNYVKGPNIENKPFLANYENIRWRLRKPQSSREHFREENEDDGRELAEARWQARQFFIKSSRVTTLVKVHMYSPSSTPKVVRRTL